MVQRTHGELQALGLEAGRVFTPTSPIDERSLFAGREEQVRLIVDVIGQKGQHAVLYGERGVGKTSLANVLASFLGDQSSIISPRINCDATDTFDSVWRKLFEQIELTRTSRPVGFAGREEAQKFSISETIQTGDLNPERVRRVLTLLSQSSVPILIVDEFDRLSEVPRRAFADTIKTLSDHAVPATVILVGVGDSVEQLIEEHASVERALVQIRMPRMSKEEIESVIRTGAQRLGMTIDEPAIARVSKLSQGLPHYAHLIGLYASRVTIDQGSLAMTLASIEAAVSRAVTGTQQSVRSTYDIAVRSPRKDNLFSLVLLACALADTNELGYFAAQDVREPMQKISGKKYEIPSFAQHLNDFCDQKRGPVLYKDGMRRRFRYRFLNPLLQPFVIMRGLDEGTIKPSSLD